MALSAKALTMENWNKFFQRISSLVTLTHKDDNANILIETLQDEDINDGKITLLFIIDLYSKKSIKIHF